jgi:hypothetical protein
MQEIWVGVLNLLFFNLAHWDFTLRIRKAMGRRLPRPRRFPCPKVPLAQGLGHPWIIQRAA